MLMHINELSKRMEKEMAELEKKPLTCTDCTVV